ncbi:hypothetical protein NG99_18910 [Erwinia typographi]|uniref:Serine protease n=1 Tax=Erwinia typographi TaxID=371042 RepID=A0A0A3YVL6_9GAMM|nr:serine protease [Erwinia typographi]KGT89406.1 hypothetical protein NG99_18910 [Erwinia typographi]
MHRISRLSFLCLTVITASSATAKNSFEIPAMENVPGPFAITKTDIDMFSLPLQGDSRKWKITTNEFKELTVTLSDILLPKGAWIEVSDISGENSEIYNQKSLYDGSKPQIITSPINAEGVVIKLVTPGISSGNGSLILKNYSSIQMKPRAIIGANQMKQAACYESINPAFFSKSNAVVKANGASGWNIAGGPYVITNHHVAGNVGNKIHSLNYNYQYPECDKTTPLNILSIKTESVVIAGNGGDQDLAVYKVDSLAYEEAGVEKIFGTLTINSNNTKNQLIENVPVYIAQHPWGDYKRIASLHDDGGPCHTLSGYGSNTLAYNCDTDGGSSGSPVLSQDDNRVVALHRAAGAANIGVLGSYLYSFIKDLLPYSNQAETATPGEGKAMVRELKIFPYMPNPPVNLDVSDAITLSSLYENRLTNYEHYTLFRARGRVSGGDIVDVNFRFSLASPCGDISFAEAKNCRIPGNWYLNSSVLAEDNPEISTSSGWITLQISNEKGERLHNLILPFNIVKYDPFTSPFGNSNEVKQYDFTGDKTLITEQVMYHSNFGFVSLYGGQGPVNTINGGTGYTTLKVQVKNHNDGNIYIMNIRGNRKTTCTPSLRPINSITGCGSTKPASLVLDYVAEDNEELPEGTYSGILPVMATRDNKAIAPILININIKK